MFRRSSGASPLGDSTPNSPSNNAIKRKNTILVEMSYFSPPINLFEILFQIQLKGYKPILAHPERYNSYHNNFEVYYKLKKGTN